MKRVTAIVINLMAVALVASCMRGTPANPYPVTGNTLNKLNLQMTKSEAEKNVGKPDAVRGAIQNKYGQTIEVWEYMLVKSPNYLTPGPVVTYWLYFCDGKLVQWGEAGDWGKEADRIYEIRFR